MPDVWRCTTCNRKLPTEPSPTLSPDYGVARCPVCKKRGIFKRVKS